MSSSAPTGLPVRLWTLWYKNPTKSNYNADLDRWPYREVDRRSYSVAVSTRVGRARRVQLLTVPRRVGLVTYLGQAQRGATRVGYRTVSGSARATYRHECYRSTVRDRPDAALFGSERSSCEPDVG